MSKIEVVGIFGSSILGAAAGLLQELKSLKFMSGTALPVKGAEIVPRVGSKPDFVGEVKGATDRDSLMPLSEF